MKWLNQVVDQLLAKYPEGKVMVSSGVSPSGPYHLGTLREVLTAEAIAREVQRRGRTSRHIHMSDDLDVFRKVPSSVPEDFKHHLGKPLCDIPAPDGSNQSYADHYLQDLVTAVDKMRLSLEIMRAHEQYRGGFFAEAIEKAVDSSDQIKQILEQISGHRVDDHWSPVQVIEDGYLKNRKIIDIDKSSQTLSFEDNTGQSRQANYKTGEVKLNWRVDWPARWALLKVQAEPFGRDHATKGGSYETGAAIIKQIYQAEPPLPLPYNFINRTGQTKKMSKSSGDVVTAADLLKILPAEVVWFFILRYPPSKQLFFDESETLIKLFDDFGELLAKPDKTADDQQLIDICLHGQDQPTVSRVPFSHLVASYQAALKDPEKTLEILARTEYHDIVEQDHETIKRELKFIDNWLEQHAPAEVKFELLDTVKPEDFTNQEKQFLSELAAKIEAAPEDADGHWFHDVIYEFKDSTGWAPAQLFGCLYRVTIGQTSGPRAGWFLSILPRDWLIKRLRLEA